MDHYLSFHHGRKLLLLPSLSLLSVVSFSFFHHLSLSLSFAGFVCCCHTFSLPLNTSLFILTLSKWTAVDQSIALNSATSASWTKRGRARRRRTPASSPGRRLLQPPLASRVAAHFSPSCHSPCLCETIFLIRQCALPQICLICVYLLVGLAAHQSRRPISGHPVKLRQQNAENQMLPLIYVGVLPCNHCCIIFLTGW